MVVDMVKVTKYGEMVVNILEIGKTISLMVLEFFITQMEMFMMGNGSMIKLMAKAHIDMLMEQNMLVSGRMINNVDMVLSNG